MSAASVTAAGRIRAEALMAENFVAYSPNGYTIVSGLEVPAYASEGTTTGKIQGGSASTADPATDFVTIGGVRRPVMRGGLHIPLSAPLPIGGDQGIGWEYECTGAGGASDSTLTGRRYLVVNVPAKSFATARRLDVVEVPSP